MDLGAAFPPGCDGRGRGGARTARGGACTAARALPAEPPPPNHGGVPPTDSPPPTRGEGGGALGFRKGPDRGSFGWTATAVSPSIVPVGGRLPRRATKIISPPIYKQLRKKITLSRREKERENIIEKIHTVIQSRRWALKTWGLCVRDGE